MITPVRITRSRRKGSRLTSPNGLPVTCVTRPSVFGNPFRPGVNCESKEDAYDMFAKAFEMAIDGVAGEYEGDEAKRLTEMVKRLPGIRGHNLACFCKQEVNLCHAEVLLHYANKPQV